MPPPKVIALADEVHAHLEQGDFAVLGPIDLGPDGIFVDAERAARIVLADVAHRSELEPSLESPTHWEDLADQLRCFERAVHQKHAEAR